MEHCWKDREPSGLFSLNTTHRHAVSQNLGFSPSGLYQLNLLCILDLGVVNHGSCSELSPEIRLGCFKAARYRWDF